MNFADPNASMTRVEANRLYRQLLPEKGLSRHFYGQLSRSRKAGFMLRRGFRWGAEGTSFNIPIAAYAAATAPRGEKLAEGAGLAASSLAFPVIEAGATAVIAMIPGVGQGVAIVGGLLTAMGLSSPLEKGVSRLVRTLPEAGLRLRRLEMGGSLLFTEAAEQSQRQALYEMSGCFQAARRHLGREAELMHQ
jgi:hypothetical protein